MPIPTHDPKLEERALVEALRRGDERAYEELVRGHGGAMLTVARRFLRDEDEARDGVQDAMIAAFKALPFFREDARLSTWLHRITVNACLMKLRSARRRPTARIEDLLPRFDDSGHRELEDGERDTLIEDQLDAPIVRAKVRACIEKLPDAYREVLLCRDIEEMDTAETATLLGISTENVKTRLHRARQALRGLIEAECAELVAP